KPSQNMRISIAQVCNCEAERHAFASSGGGSGSKARRKARISSLITILHPSTCGVPITRSSWCSISPTPFRFLRSSCAFSAAPNVSLPAHGLLVSGGRSAKGGGTLPALLCGPLAQARRPRPSIREADVHDIAVPDGVLLSLKAHFAGLLGRCLAAK